MAKEYHLNLHDSDIQAFKRAIYDLSDDKFHTIFKTFVPSNDDTSGLAPQCDGKRFQTFQTLPVLFKSEANKVAFLTKFQNHLQQVLDLIHTNLQVIECRVLKSLEKSGVQEHHKDIVDPKFPCFAGLVSLDQDTNILSERSPVIFYRTTPFKTTRIGVGRVLVFRGGDLLHSGGAYTAENRRIYFKALPRNKQFDPVVQKGRVQVMFKCDAKNKGCGLSFESETALKNHRFYCKDVHGEAEVKNRVAELAARNQKRHKTK